jgi:HK97 family phage prohead protease
MLKEDLIELPRRARPAEVRAQSFDEKANTIDLVFTTGATVRRCSWFDGSYDEELVVGPKNVRLERLNAGAPFLNSHDCWDLEGVIGSVVPGSARIADGIGIATVQLSRRDDVAGIVQDIRDGVIRNVSVGYRYHKVEKTEKDDGSVPLWRVVDWEPFELSAVSVPADPGAQVRSESGRKLEQFPCIVSRHMPAGSLRVPGHVAIRRMRMRMLALEFGLAA